MHETDRAPKELLHLASRFWQQQGVPALERYVTIPCLSPDFDPDWELHGHLRTAALQMREWVDALELAGTTTEILQLPGLTPFLLVDVAPSPAAGVETKSTLIYGHLDKQPPAGPWRIGDAFTPTRKDEALYGRGAADDGYALFAALGAIRSLQQLGIPHGRCVVIIEASEESMSIHLDAYLQHERLAAALGVTGPGLMVCLDSGCPTYDRLWVTTSMRGHVVLTLRADVLTEEAHSGGYGGLVPDSFRVLRQLLSRIEDPLTGFIQVEECHSAVPTYRAKQIRQLVRELGADSVNQAPALPGLAERSGPDHEALARMVYAQTWEPSLAVTGADGLPTVQDGGSVIRPFTTTKLSMRIAPSADPSQAANAVRARLVATPPEGARVTVEILNTGAGFDAPPVEPWLDHATETASAEYYGSPAASVGRGGTNPFLSAVSDRFPGAQVLATGVLGPGSNAHAPDEMLHLPTVEKLTASLAHILSQACRERPSRPEEPQ